MKLLTPLVALAMFAGVSARADDISLDLACKFHHRVVEIASFDALPGAVKDLLRPKLGVMAKRGEYFNATDVIERPAPARRFIRAGRSGDMWFVWYEHGGLAYARNIIVLEWTPKSIAPRLITNVTYRDSPCVKTDAILDGHVPAQVSGWW